MLTSRGLIAGAFLALTIHSATSWATSKNTQPSSSQTAQVNKWGMQFALVRPDCFLMGADDADRSTALELVLDHAGVTKPDHFDDEVPVHLVRISQPFLLGRFEVTQAQWIAVMGRNPSANPNCGKDCPVENISWLDAQRFVRELNRRDRKHHYWLPTEAEWEFAARAGAGALLSDPDEQGWYATNSGDERLDSAGAWRADLSRYGEALQRVHAQIHAAGSKRPNARGLFDMFGNVWEWVGDWYDRTYYMRSVMTDPQGPKEGTEKVLRGGAFDHNTLVNAPVVRAKFAPDGRAPSFGMRVAMAVPKSLVANPHTDSPRCQ